jgi:predicted SAM-dependent methyltransferase
MEKLNFGCGLDYKKGYTNADITPKVKADVYFDFEKFPYPFKDNKFDRVYASHILEHLKNVVRILEELHRISKAGAIIEIKTPYFTTPGAMTNFHHITYFSSGTLNIFEPKSGYHYYTSASYHILEKKIAFGRLYKYLGLQFLFNKFQTVYEAFFCFIFPAREMQYKLLVIK